MLPVDHTAFGGALGGGDQACAFRVLKFRHDPGVILERLVKAGNNCTLYDSYLRFLTVTIVTDGCAMSKTIIDCIKLPCSFNVPRPLLHPPPSRCLPKSLRVTKEFKVLVVPPRNVLLRGLFRPGFRLIQHPAKILDMSSSQKMNVHECSHANISRQRSRYSIPRTRRQGVKERVDRKLALWKPHLIHRIRASMVGNAHPRFVYILHKQMPKSSRLERDWRGRLHGSCHVQHCEVEQAVTVQAGPPGSTGRVPECRGRRRATVFLAGGEKHLR